MATPLTPKVFVIAAPYSLTDSAEHITCEISVLLACFSHASLNIDCQETVSLHLSV